MLGDALEVIAVQTMDDAFALLGTAPNIDLIVATFRFDDSQMLGFLQAIKRSRNLHGIPFYCIRVLPDLLEDDLAGRMGAVCIECGATGFVDVSHLPRQAAVRAISSMLAG